MRLELGQLSLSMETGQVVRWLVVDGDYVQHAEIIVEVETDKAVAEVEAPASGYLTIAAQEGESIPVGGLLADIDEEAG